MTTYQRSAIWALGLGALLLLESPALAGPDTSTTVAQASPDVDDLFGDEGLFDDEDLFGDEDVAGDDEDASGSEEDTDPTPEEPDPSESEVIAADDDLEAVAPSLDEDPAPPTAGPTEGMEEILVQGTAGQGIDVNEGVSVTSFDAKDLAAMGVQDIADVAQFTPNLEIRSSGSTSATFFIRGVGLNDFTANAAGAVAIYQDDVPLNLPAIQLGQIYDVESVQVLLGPQGSGPGRNASAGAIKTYSRKPSGELGGFLRTDLGNYNFKDFEGAAEFPLIADVLSARLAFAVSQRDGLMSNRCSGAPPRGVERITNPAVRFQQPICNESRQTVEWRRQGLPAQAPSSVEFDPAEFPQLTLPRYSNVPYALTRDAATGLFNDVPPGLDDELWGLGRWAGRAQLRFLPPDSDLEILFNIHGSRIDQPGIVGQSIGTNGNFLGGRLAGYQVPEIQAESDAITAKIRAQNGGAPLNQEQRRQRDNILARNLTRRPLDRKPFEGDFNRDSKERLTALGGFVQITSEFADLGFLGSGALSSNTALEWYDRNRRSDADYTPQTIFEQDTNDSAWQVTQGLVLAGELANAPVAWELGGFLLAQELNYRQDVSAANGVLPVLRDFRQDTTDFGIFAGGSWDIFDDFTLDAGGRFNWQRTEFDTEIIRGASSACGIPMFPCVVRQIDWAPTGTVRLTYRFNDESNVYYKYARGWKGRQMNPASAQGPPVTQAEPEKVDAHEIGISADFFDSALRLNGAVFVYDYKEKQEFVTQDSADSAPQRVVLNAEDARIYGAELDLTLRPFDLLPFIPDEWSGLEVTTRFGWLETEYLDFSDLSIRSTLLQDSDPPIPPMPIPVVLDYTGNRLPNTPRFKISVAAEWPFDFGRYGTVTPRYDLSWSDDVSFDPSGGIGGPDKDGQPILPELTVGQRAFALHHFRLSYRVARGNLEISGWVRNITNEVYKTFGFDASAGPKLVGYLLGVPRTYGGSIRIEF